MNQGFGQFCPIALASEVLTQRWMLLIIHEMTQGSSRFSDIRRGVPKISATLLKQRLETLEDADIVVRKSIGNNGNSEYFLTEAGRELDDILIRIGGWGQRWARDIHDDDLDPNWLIWSMHRRLNIADFPEGRTSIHIEFTDTHRDERHYWLIVNNGKVDVCRKYPGYVEDIQLTSSIRIMAEVWRGIRSIRDEIKNGSIVLTGPSKLRRAFPKLLLLSPVANIKSKRKNSDTVN